MVQFHFIILVPGAGLTGGCSRNKWHIFFFQSTALTVLLMVQSKGAALHEHN